MSGRLGTVSDIRGRCCAASIVAVDEEQTKAKTTSSGDFKTLINEPSKKSIDDDESGRLEPGEGEVVEVGVIAVCTTGSLNTINGFLEFLELPFSLVGTRRHH